MLNLFQHLLIKLLKQVQDDFIKSLFPDYDAFIEDIVNHISEVIA